MWRFRIVRVRRKVRKTVASKKEYLEKKELARKLVLERLDFWKSYYLSNFGIALVWNRVGIKNTITRWGSCSSKKNLNFSFRIISLTEAQQDYLVVHELCHLLEMNHGENFWKLVSLGISDYKKLRASLKNYRLS